MLQRGDPKSSKAATEVEADGSANAVDPVWEASFEDALAIAKERINLVDRKGAFDAYHRALQLRPKDPLAISGLGKLHEIGGNMPLAALAFKQAIGLAQELAVPDREFILEHL